MRKSHVFVGSSHPELGQMVCDRLGVEPGKCTLKKFANGETSIEIGVSVRDEDVYVIQSGSDSINDHIMELLILISGCKGGSANKITAVIPYFPYSKQSKMKKHRGAITARMLANLLTMAGADHVITMDLHATQMQGFFTKPVDNLYAGPTLARWIRLNVPEYHQSVIVSKNPGGTKRVTSLADALKVNFAMIHTDRRRTRDQLKYSSPNSSGRRSRSNTGAATPTNNSSNGSPDTILEDDEEGDEDDDDDDVVNAHGIQVARVVQGHVVDDDYTEPEQSQIPGLSPIDGESTVTNLEQPQALGGTVDIAGSDDDEDEAAFHLEKIITLVGDVRDRAAIIVDDMIDRPGSYIAAAEHCRLNCGAKRVYIIATHGVFGGDSLEQLNACPCIDQIVITNTYPIAPQRVARAHKLTVIDISPIFAECIRRNHHGESISALFEQLAFV